ncbi:MAG: hypothetical protein K0S47_2106 [Herbinix sp.]|nr:hypothetical protein [Herbinix sp.]
MAILYIISLPKINVFVFRSILKMSIENKGSLISRYTLHIFLEANIVFVSLAISYTDHVVFVEEISLILLHLPKILIRKRMNVC